MTSSTPSLPSSSHTLSHSYDFFRPSPSSPSLLSKPPFSEDDDMSVLDDRILDPSSSPADHHRRPSYDHASDAFSHRDSVWSDFSPPVSCALSRQNSHVGHAVFDSASAPNPFMHLDPAHPASAYAHQPWPVSKDSGSCTPTGTFDHAPSDIDHASSGPLSAAVGPVNPVNIPPMSFRQGMAFPAGSAMSPQSQGWFPGSTDVVESGSRSVKSPTYRHGSPLSVRRDGIRKKNARFEIPAERTLSNIDHLISQSTNEDDVKELKMQKRLLRNRQAALDSRQRKKLHTEKLEEEKKQFTQVIGELEDALQSMRIQEAEHLREKGEWMAAQQQINQYIDGMHMEKDELIRRHTLESADLRKKNNILKETVEKLERQIKSPAAPALSQDYSGFENMTVDTAAWEDFPMVNGLSLDAGQVPAQPAQSAVVPSSDKAPEKPSADYPFSWNAFYMCLLFGAFIASNSPSFSANSVPQLSDEYRAESANVLKAVLSSSPPELSQREDQPMPSAAPMPSTISGAEMAGMANGPSSNLDELHNTLAMPTEQQEQEQVFALNADQYNTLTTLEDTSLDYKPQQPSNLQQALTAMRNSAAHSKMQNRATSDVYTRSVMWDHVPEKVIRDFRRMVQDYSPASVKEEDPGFGLA